MNTKVLTYSEFHHLRVEWNTLLANSRADPLFLSWEWLYHWWDIFGSQPDDELFILTAFNANDELVGIAPLYIQTRYLFNRKLASRRLQFLGNSCQGVAGFRTENMQFIAKSGQEKTVVSALLDFIFQSKGFDECMFSDLVVGSDTYSLIEKKKSNSTSIYREPRIPALPMKSIVNKTSPLF